MCIRDSLIDDWKDDKSLTKKTYAEMLKKDFEKAKKGYPIQAKADVYKRQAQNMEDGAVATEKINVLKGRIDGASEEEKAEIKEEIKTCLLYTSRCVEETGSILLLNEHRNGQ